MYSLNKSFNEIKSLILEKQPDKRTLLSILNRATEFYSLDTRELLSLLHPANIEYLELFKDTAHYINTVRHGKVVNFYAPIYISNTCINNCVYCGFRRDNKTPRLTLNFEEIEQEALEIRNLGIEHILIVSGEDPKTINLNYLKTTVGILRKYFASISIEVAPMSTSVYRTLVEEGVDGLACYQETYDPDKYKQYHISGPKSNYEYRLEVHDRGGEAGFRNLVLGSLLGISEYYVEAYFFLEHARYLAKKYWQSLPSISFPRFRPYGGDFVPKYPVSDDELKLLLAVSRIVLPDSNMIISTREPANLREELVVYGINQMSAGSKTNPLGYTGIDSNTQFEVNDDRTPQEVAEAIAKKGYEPVFKNWDMGFSR